MNAKYVFPKALKEVRFHLSQTGEASVPLRYVNHNNKLIVFESIHLTNLYIYIYLQNISYTRLSCYEKTQSFYPCFD